MVSPNFEVEHNQDVVDPAKVEYADFWNRSFAFLIDIILISIALSILQTFFGTARDLLLLGKIQPPGAFNVPMDPFLPQPPLLVFMNFLFLAVEIIIAWLYWAIMESSSWQATIGKDVLGIRITDLDGKRITFARASARFFTKIISALPLFYGFIMVGFAPKKQALHDRITGCLVVKHKRQSTYEKWWYSLNPEQQKIFSSISTKQRTLLLEEPPNTREEFFNLNEELRNNYLIELETGGNKEDNFFEKRP